MSPLTDLIGIDWSLWILWVLGIICFLTGGACVIMGLALPELPRNPRIRDRARYRLHKLL